MGPESPQEPPIRHHGGARAPLVSKTAAYRARQGDDLQAPPFKGGPALALPPREGTPRCRCGAAPTTAGRGPGCAGEAPGAAPTGTGRSPPPQTQAGSGAPGPGRAREAASAPVRPGDPPGPAEHAQSASRRPPAPAGQGRGAGGGEGAPAAAPLLKAKAGGCCARRAPLKPRGRDLQGQRGAWEERVLL